MVEMADLLTNYNNTNTTKLWFYFWLIEHQIGWY